MLLSLHRRKCDTKVQAPRNVLMILRIFEKRRASGSIKVYDKTNNFIINNN